MKKRIVLSVFISSSFVIYTMESNSGFLSYFPGGSYFSSFSELLSGSQTSNASSLVPSCRTNMNNLENKLQFGFMEKLNGMTTLLLAFDVNRIETESYSFLKYCYYYRHWKQDDQMMHLNDLSLDSAVLKKCHNAQIDGYSALGAAMIAKDITLANRRLLTQDLVTHGFKPTPNDVSIAELLLYDGALQHREKFMHLCNEKSLAYWSVLPKDLKQQIMNWMIKILKKEFWLLPQEESSGALQ